MSVFSEPPPRPFLKWAGGKRQLLTELLAAVDAAKPFRSYHEPFLGGGALFFALTRTKQISENSFLSDVNEGLISAYLGVRDHVHEVIHLLREHRHNHNESYYYYIRAQSPQTLPQRAARIIYLNKTCYNGLYRENSRGEFNTPFGRYKNPQIFDEENLIAVAAALNRAEISRCTFSSLLATAGPGDLVYFDPPYHPVSSTSDFTAYSAGGFDTDAQKELAGVFRELAGQGIKVILSNSMTDFTVALYRGFYIYEVFATRLVNSKADQRGRISEALITSFPMNIGREPIVAPSDLDVRHPNGWMGGIEKMLAKQWLRENNYNDIADMIDEVDAEWKAAGKSTRRNWWEILAGDRHGNPRVVAGRVFPVLQVAQLRQGLPVTTNALCRNPTEEAPPIRITGRWSK